MSLRIGRVRRTTFGGMMLADVEDINDIDDVEGLMSGTDATGAVQTSASAAQGPSTGARDPFGTFLLLLGAGVTGWVALDSDNSSSVRAWGGLAFGGLVAELLVR
jgi:hypothetical protein